MINNRFVLGDLDDIKVKGNKTWDKTLALGTFSYMAPELLKAFK